MRLHNGVFIPRAVAALYNMFRDDFDFRMLSSGGKDKVSISFPNIIFINVGKESSLAICHFFVDFVDALIDQFGQIIIRWFNGFNELKFICNELFLLIFTLIGNHRNYPLNSISKIPNLFRACNDSNRLLDLDNEITAFHNDLLLNGTVIALQGSLDWL